MGRECSSSSAPSLLDLRYLLVGVAGTTFALFGIFANGLLSVLFLTRAHYRHSPFFFLGFVALFDTFLDCVYILLLAVPVHAAYLYEVHLLHSWVALQPTLYYLGQICKMASTFCLIVASIERYCMTKHWTFTGFETRTRWILLALLFVAAICLKIFTTEVVVIVRPHCPPLQKYVVGSVTRSDSPLLGLLGMASIAIPFATLIFLNGGIVMMLRRQNVQQLRSWITELTMGKDVMKIRRKNLRSATNTLIAIITAYLISNALNLALTMIEFLHRDTLHHDYATKYRMAADVAGVLTALGNAIRCPAHFLSNSEIRQQFYIMFLGESTDEKGPSSPLHRRLSEGQQPPAWYSLLLSVRSEEEKDSPLPTSPFLLAAPRTSFKRHSAIAIV